ncbi:multipass membrane protein [Candidatus Mancarchaeum acidiphilum]|uniref:Multipass membrane protein n=1 Tax=Candidatus Mancarchaeum acidiphilum TaxID=1920749 RepID=A0A218NMD6_9ARCH|nr:hypothetical protein [Candidatus Mancarchaeum acidiphilum]ASI13623.1 multipass membrane protein [Candidatus Mancarchaeum acidiphilum]
MKQRDLPSNRKASFIWILVSAIPFDIGSVIAILWVLSSTNKNKAYSLLYLIPVIGPIISYVLTESKDEYLSSMAGWVFLGQILGGIILEVLIAL